MKGLPLSYNRDMQEDKEPLFDTVDTVKLCLRVNVEMLKTLEFKGENMKKSASGRLCHRDRRGRLPGPQGCSVPFCP